MFAIGIAIIWLCAFVWLMRGFPLVALALEVISAALLILWAYH